MTRAFSSEVDPGSREENASKKESPAAGITEDGFLGGQLRLRQPRSGHRAGHDAILLAAATPARPGDRVVDLGAGVGAAGLAVARRVRGIDLVLVEIDPALAELARNNAGTNAIMAEVIVLDVEAGAAAFDDSGLGPDSADVVLMNPPFNDPSRHRASPDGVRERAHVATATTLAGWVHAARRILKSNGQLALIWRADGIAEVLAALDRGFGSLEILPVHGDGTSPAIRILVRATKGGRAPTRLHAALLLNEESGVPNKWVQEVLAGKGELPLARR
ncbi:tRNA1(Val) A37 N6-methylase TrmN6 [Bradyrhizobium japonicum]|jgi:tRNA1(Val) A37 N6-methylase TrmN6|uniref:tRNA1(Val) A37 N6-methylase TrmN6 n=1 Tax=Bradyrhizobium elkanii TaxID=29448 RepID=A0A7Y8R2C6_BRAEL|nr:MULTISPECIES: methyltransferase [Bradyrhizobium]UQD83709.1 methyltransferase [Bradyrhizobium elkanii USDA 76]MBP1295270.1 tRNA1(Val) A37 N6-methylase TrmN6 [Bradyrhizobium elkanii]MCP1750811.1 tRNA1(Val) A37 N6-methylase TrmN6 [Bradyrhizobium elkanii]MCP1976585.1 tRNA1(Val) A37 N6-methylase TrmN6 [Bradyrhizobium elkanii]MCS4212082.1 tRNA1(Val) A37 N6-methylase TrmN6 [Bradyrhizobium elkanii]